MVTFKRLVKKKLGELLIEKGVINEDQLKRALQVQKERGGLIGEVLVSLGFTGEEEIAQALTVQYGVPYLPLRNYELSKDIVKIIPKEIAKKHSLIAVDKIGDILTVAMTDPLNSKAVDEVAAIVKCNVQVFVCTMTDVSAAIEKLYSRG